MAMRLAFAVAAALLATLPARAAAQEPPAVQAAIASGIVGERYDGYLGFARAPSARLIRQVGAINIRRRSLYSDLAVRRNVTTAVAGVAVACELLARIAVGQVYMLSDGRWRRRQPGEPAPRPDHCG